MVEFTAAYPDVSLTIVTPRRLGEVSDPEVDVFITYGTGDLPGMQVDHVLDVVSSPMCSPGLLNRLAKMPEPQDVLRFGLLHLFDYEDWQAWFDLMGLDDPRVRSGVVFSDMHLVHSAALAGQGVMMGDVVLGQQTLQDGLLVRPFERSLRSPRSYFMAVADDLAMAPATAAFRAWVKSELS